jgi:hypothetical protein
MNVPASGETSGIFSCLHFGAMSDASRAVDDWQNGGGRLARAPDMAMFDIDVTAVVNGFASSGRLCLASVCQRMSFTSLTVKFAAFNAASGSILNRRQITERGEFILSSICE